MDIIFALAFISIVSFLIYYKRTKRLLYKQILIVKKDYENIFDIISKIERRTASPIDEFNADEDGADWVVIISYNRPYFLKITVESLRKYEPNVKVVIVDNGSEQETVDEIMRLQRRNLVNKVLLNKNEEVPQWQKSFAIVQAVKLLSMESVSSITIADDDIEVTQAWIEDANEILKQMEDIKLICLMEDEIQNICHPTEALRNYNSKAIRIKNSFNGAFFYLKVDVLKELGYPPIREGITDAGVEDWYYTRQLKARNWKVATLNCCNHLGYENSVREKVLQNYIDV